MTKLHLFFHGRFPSEKAASLFAAKSAEAFAKRGIEVTLVVPKRKDSLQEDPFSYYGVEKKFKIVRLGILDLFGSRLPARLAFWTSFITFSIASFFYASGKTDKEDIFYSNETLPLFFISFARPKAFYEMHDFPESKLGLFGWFLGRMRWVLIHNKWKLEEAKKSFPKVDPRKYFYEPNAVDLAAFDTTMTKEEARRQLAESGQMPFLESSSKKIAVYTGHLYGWKGVDTLAEAAKLLPEMLIVFVGGTDSDIRNFTNKYAGPKAATKNIIIAGHKPHADIPIWQKAADVLVLPNTAKEKISAYYTSPMKLFEYMASKRPIVASDIPSLHDIIDAESVLFVAPDNVRALADGIERLASDGHVGSILAQHAFKAVLFYTWDKRAERILTFISL